MPWKDPAKKRAYLRRYQRAWKAKLAARWKAAGGCPRCGTPPSAGFVICLRCRRQASALYHRQKTQRLRPCPTMGCDGVIYRVCSQVCGRCQRRQAARRRAA